MKYGSVAVMAALIVAGCSSRPREFTPRLAAPAADPVAFAAAYEACRVAVASGKRSVGASAGAGAAATAATAAAGTATATAAGGYAGMAVLGATIVALPVVGVLGAWGIAKKKKSKKENRIKADTAFCLQESGYQVAGWQQAGARITEERREARKRAK